LGASKEIITYVERDVERADSLVAKLKIAGSFEELAQVTKLLHANIAYVEVAATLLQVVPDNLDDVFSLRRPNLIFALLSWGQTVSKRIWKTC
jgi:hypothetical protein